MRRGFDIRYAIKRRKKCAKDSKSSVGDHGEKGIYNCKAKQSPVVYTCAIGNWVQNDKAIAIKSMYTRREA